MCLCEIAENNIPKACHEAHPVKKSGCYMDMFEDDFRKHLSIRIVEDGVSLL